MGITTTASRSQHLRRPRFDYEDPAARAIYEAQLLEELDAIRSDEFLPGSLLLRQPFLHSSVHFAMGEFVHQDMAPIKPL